MPHGLTRLRSGGKGRKARGRWNRSKGGQKKKGIEEKDKKEEQNLPNMDCTCKKEKKKLIKSKLETLSKNTYLKNKKETKKNSTYLKYLPGSLLYL